MTGQSVVVVPYWSMSDAINFDSNYSFLRQVIPEMSKLRPDWYWFILWPYGTAGADRWRYQPDGFFTDRIIPIRWSYDTSRSSSIISFDAMRLKEIDEGLAPTIYWIHQVESAVFFQRGYRDTRSVLTLPAIVAQHHYTAHASRESDATISPSAYLQMIGLLVANRVVSNSKYAARMATETFTQYLNFNTMSDINKKTTVLPFGLVPDSLPKTREYPKPVMLYNHRFEDYKQPDITAKVLKLLKKKHQFEVWITQTQSQAVAGFPFDKSVGTPNRQEYLANIAVPAINTMNSRHETFCISALDSMMLGHLLVMPKALAFPEILPPDYPYLFTSPTHQYAMLDDILERWPKSYEEWSPRLRAHAKSQFRLAEYAKRYCEILEEEATRWVVQVPKKTTKDAVDKVYDAMKQSHKMTSVAEVTRAVHRVAGIQSQAFNARRTVREFTSRGATLNYDKSILYLTV